MNSALDPSALDQLFVRARTCYDWTEQGVGDDLVQKLYDLVRLGPTSSNTSPARFVWVRTSEAKAKLIATASPGNRLKLQTAPLVVIIGNDHNFAEALPRLLPAERAQIMQEMFKDAALAQATAMRNGSLQGAYLILAARALGLDCGPMSGFDNDAVDDLFFDGTSVKSNFLCCIGYGKQPPFPRNPRLSFHEANRFV